MKRYSIKKGRIFVCLKQANIQKLTFNISSSPCIVFPKTSFFCIFHRHMLLRMNLLDKIIKNRCSCSFCHNFCVKIQKILAQKLLFNSTK